MKLEISFCLIKWYNTYFAINYDFTNTCMYLHLKILLMYLHYKMQQVFERRCQNLSFSCFIHESEKHNLQVSCIAALGPFMVNIPSHDSCILMFWKCSFPSIYPCFCTDKINSKQLHYVMSLSRNNLKQWDGQHCQG